MRFCRTDDRFANTWRSKGGCSWITFPSPRRVPPELLHVSLYNVEQSARISDAVIFAACRTASAIDTCQFELSFDHVATFRKSRRNAIVLSGNGGRELLRQLHVQMGNLGEDARINRNLQPHATLLYDSEVMPRVTLQKPVVVAAREFVLLRNRPGEQGYEFVDRWPLRARG
ncbi:MULTISPECIES: 2'-5' RNA ligase family protein [unclassified Rhizobium]|uniref:2'-5' RNA ligase family protein n=1 Tax=unclassified Rhizobium TaxID=2613769 RepID=UPI0010F1599B|nr:MULTISPECIES: 2'-5' RNA ligase family protein [unclassified Rhizobium]MBB3398395.1 2'-5' RNA ligase [Rhizobium sp. BK060]MBB4166901.1 2'-5' RNA ligase [Rhizobium sp. BK538]TCM67132.1 2'-5' RNA ligase [Rhizobium sp. BK068]